MTTQDTTGKKFLRETDARILIDRQLREASWNIEDKNQVLTEEALQTGRADYILKDGRGRAAAVVATLRDPELNRRKLEEIRTRLSPLQPQG